jgi:hypothetical protein
LTPANPAPTIGARQPPKPTTGNGKMMKPILTLFTRFGIIALLTLAAGCVSARQTKQTEQLLYDANFKTVAATTAKQEQQLKALPRDKVTMVQRNGKTCYVFPDVAHNQIYVGSPKQYQSYQQILADYKLTGGPLEAAKIDQAEISSWVDQSNLWDD